LPIYPIFDRCQSFFRWRNSGVEPRAEAVTPTQSSIRSRPLFHRYLYR